MQILNRMPWLTVAGVAAVLMTSGLIPTNDAFAQSTCVRNELFVEAHGHGPRGTIRAKRRAERRWKSEATGLYGCQYGRLEHAIVHQRWCDKKVCAIRATPCKATGLICSN